MMDGESAFNCLDHLFTLVLVDVFYLVVAGDYKISVQ